MYNSPYGPLNISDCLTKMAAERMEMAKKTVEETKKEEAIADPVYYEGKYGTSAIDIVEEFDLGFCLGNVIKYVLRAGKKAGNSEMSDLNKALWYLDRYREILKEDM